jgi:hypothetical protein
MEGRGILWLWNPKPMAISMNQEDFKPTMPPQILFLVEI